MQWILFFEKILKLAQHFPAEFEGLKNSALKQYQECAHQVLADFNQVFVNENFLVNFKRTQRSKAGKSTLMQRTEQTSDHAKKQRAARATRDLFGVAQKQNLYPTLIGRSILKATGLLESPTQIFEKCMEILANAKKNLKEQKDINQVHLAIYEYFNYLEKGVDNLVEVINENLIQDIDEKICAVIAQMFRHDARANRDLANQQSSGISSDKDVSFVQASLDMIETFQKIAEKHTITKISKDLLDVFNRVV